MENDFDSFEMFNSISFCPNCFMKGSPQNKDNFVFFNTIEDFYFIIEITNTKETFGPLTNLGLITKGFTPHIVSFLRQKESYLFSTLCSICESDIHKSRRGDLVFSVTFRENRFISLKRFLEIRSRCF